MGRYTDPEVDKYMEDHDCSIEEALNALEMNYEDYYDYEKMEEDGVLD